MLAWLFNSMKTLITIPTLNEGGNIESLIHQVVEAVPCCDVLVLDSYSRDGTAEIVQGVAARHSNVHLMLVSASLGMAGALVEGFEWGIRHGYDRVANMDGDSSHHPRYLPGLLSSLSTADVAVGSRRGAVRSGEDWAWYRVLLTVCAANVVRTTTGMQIRDPTSGYRAFRTNVLRKCDLRSLSSRGFYFHVELLHLLWGAGCRIVELPIHFHKRAHGESKLSSGIILEAICLSYRLYVKSRKHAVTHFI
jgi:dolichol-phosphate mannosyltransferase